MTTFDQRLRELMAEKGLGLRELARRVPCNSGYLSRVMRGRQRPSERLAALLDEALEANGELRARLIW